MPFLNLHFLKYFIFIFYFFYIWAHHRLFNKTYWTLLEILRIEKGTNIFLCSGLLETSQSIFIFMVLFVKNHTFVLGMLKLYKHGVGHSELMACIWYQTILDNKLRQYVWQSLQDPLMPIKLNKLLSISLSIINFSIFYL